MSHAGDAPRAVMLVCVLLAGSGCAVNRRAVVQREYLIGVRYDLGSANVSNDAAQRQARVRADLEVIRDLGFNGVVFDYLGDGERGEMVDAAGRHGLKAVLTDRDIYYYLLTGRTRRTPRLAALVRAKLDPVRTLPAFAGVGVFGGYPVSRLDEVIAVLDEAGIPCFVPGQARSQTSNAALSALIWIDSGAAESKSLPEASPLERMLLEYHRELAAGCTGGIVVDLPAGLLGTASLEAGKAPLAQKSAVTALVRRARVWGGLLHGSLPEAGPADVDGPSDSLSTVVFARGARRYLLVFNHSSEPTRGTFRYAGQAGGRAIQRAVEIPPSADRGLGQVFEARRGELAIELPLRPGDAALLELF